jgi:hypothetical protein
MLELAKGMTKEERDRYKEEGLYEQLVDLQNECDWETDMVNTKLLFLFFHGFISIIFIRQLLTYLNSQEGLQEIYELFDEIKVRMTTRTMKMKQQAILLTSRKYTLFRNLQYHSENEYLV